MKVYGGEQLPGVSFNSISRVISLCEKSKLLNRVVITSVMDSGVLAPNVSIRLYLFSGSLKANDFLNSKKYVNLYLELSRVLSMPSEVDKSFNISYFGKDEDYAVDILSRHMGLEEIGYVLYKED